MRNATLVLLVILLASTAAATGHVAREDALNAIERAEGDVMDVMEVKNNTQRLNDSLNEADLALRQATYAEYIRNGSNGTGAQRAALAMEGRDSDRYHYSDVLRHTREVKQLRDTALNLTDRLVATRLRLDDYREQGLDVTDAAEALEQAEQAYRQEQYEDVEEGLLAANNDLDQAQSERSVTDLLAASGSSFVATHVDELAIGGLSLILASLLVLQLYRKRRDTKRYEHLKQRLSVIRDMMEDAQESYFVDESLSKSVYQARMASLRDRISETEEELATVAERIGKEPQ